METQRVFELVVRGFEAVGVLALVAGSLWSLFKVARAMAGGARNGQYRALREGVGRSILLGLEILIIADIVQTITITPTLESAASLGVIVLVRTFLSFSIEVELEGRLPWRRIPQVPRPAPE